MVLDSSALIALLLQEPEATRISQCIEMDPVRFISAANWLESQMVLSSKFGAQGPMMLETLFRELRVEIVPLDSSHVIMAFSVWQRYGKGRHPAALNLGDCCAYATAVLKNQPLLFKGNDFSATDIRAVVY